MKITKTQLILFGAIILIITIAGVIAYFSSKKKITLIPIAITNTVPVNNSTGASVFDPITISFNQDVDSKTIYVSSEPQESWTISQDSPDSIKVDHQLYLKVATTYKLTVLQNGSLAGTLTFETAHEQNDPRQLQNIKSELDKNYPLANFVPYETTNYRVFYSAPLTLEIVIKAQINQQDVMLQVQSWVKSKGIDPSTHKYVFVSPTP